MSTEAELRARAGAQWAELDALLREMERGPSLKKPIGRERLPVLYTAVCEQLSIARSRGYGEALTRRLDGLARRAWFQLYRRRQPLWAPMKRFIAGGFSRLLRREWRLFALCCGLFYGPGLLVGLWLALRPDDAHWILSPQARESMAMMYLDRGAADSLRQGGGDNTEMFGHYIYNNISIDFQCFAGGVLFGLGTLFYLLFNAVYLGAVAGWLSGQGAGHSFWGFVAGHSAPELMGVAVSATAGLMLARGLLWPARLGRIESMRREAPDALRVLAGAALLTGFAAIIEGFWSAQPFPPGIKYAFAALIWASTLYYLLLAGQRRAG